MTIWHLFPAISLIASIASANGIAKTQHASAAIYGLCLLTGILLGCIAAFGNCFCAKIVQRAVRNHGQSAKIAMLSLLFIAGVGWIVLADMSGRWAAIAVLHTFAR